MNWAISKKTSFLKKLKLFFKILLRKTKPITVEIIYRPPNQNNFLQTLKQTLAKLDTLQKELYILGDFNINLYQNQNHGGCKNNTLVSAIVFNDVKNYLRFSLKLTSATKLFFAIK